MNWKLSEGEKFRRAQILAANAILLLDAITDPMGATVRLSGD